MEISLEKVDILRERAGIGYERAVEYLTRAGGDVVQALVAAEQDVGRGELPAVPARVSGDGSAASEGPEPCPGALETAWSARHVAADVLDRVKHLVEVGNRTHIRVSHRGKTVAELPVTVGVVGVLLAPQLAAIAAVASLAGGCSVGLEPVVSASTGVGPVGPGEQVAGPPLPGAGTLGADGEPNPA